MRKPLLTVRQPLMPAGTALHFCAHVSVDRRECWVGARLDTWPDYIPCTGALTVCVLPMLPVHVWWWPTDPEGVL